MTQHDKKESPDMRQSSLSLLDGNESDDSDWGLEDPSTADTYTVGTGGRGLRSSKKSITREIMDRMSLKTDFDQLNDRTTIS